MDVELDEDFANFESMSQMALASSVDEELILLDREVTRREHEFQDEKRERNNNETTRNNNGSLNGCGETSGALNSERREGFELGELKKEEGKCVSSLSGTMEDKVLTTFPFGVGKRLTMIPVKYKLKDERRKILKISVNKLKKIEDPESWLCRSVLINNTMKKLQKETRDEKIQKQLSGVSVSFSSNLVSKQGGDDLFQCKLGQGSLNEEVSCGTQNPAYENSNRVETNSEENRRSANGNRDDIEVSNATETREAARENQQDKLLSERVKSKSRQGANETQIPVLPTDVSLQEDLDEAHESLLTLTERCLSRKNSFADAVADCPFENSDNPPFRETDDVDECCDVHDVLSQLYLPPTPRMLTSIDSDTDEDELNDQSRSGCGKLPHEVDFPREKDPSPKRIREELEESEAVEGCPKRRKSCNGCTDSPDCAETISTYRCNRRQEKEEEEDAKNRLSRSLSSQYSKGPGETFYEDNNCESPYSCGHAVSLFGGELQAVGFHNLIAGLET